MKRLHIHLKTEKLDQSVAYYTALFGEEPTVLKVDYAKWLLDDPKANIALSTHGGTPGIDHVGLQIDDDETLAAITGRLKEADAAYYEEEQASCCYAKSNKTWSRDPQGAVWEVFHSFDDQANYGAEPDRAMLAATEKPAERCC
jgi:catechol 2,3-dioxygenase-like lactoylglutathione lyase family enzyme